MGCDTRNNDQVSNRNLRNNNICETLRRIEQVQKEALLASACGRDLTSCDSSLIAAVFNTKPISIYTSEGIFEATVGPNGPFTRLFRVEDVKGCDVVVLRLLTLENGVYTCTPYTFIFKIDCICCLQCFDPTNCPIC